MKLEKKKILHSARAYKHKKNKINFNRKDTTKNRKKKRKKKEF
jgi:hypothetical protein